MQFFGGTPGCCGSCPTGAKLSGSNVQMRCIKSFDRRDHSMPVASVPTWCAMPAARGEKMVRSEPRSFCSLSWGSTLFTRSSSVIPSSAVAGFRIGSARPASCLKRNASIEKNMNFQQMKREGRKIVGVVCWDYPMARIADRAGADLVSVGDSVGVNLWGQAPDEITLDEMLIVCRAVRRGVKRALLSCDLPGKHQTVEA